LTTYGRQYIHLRNTIFTPPILVLWKYSSLISPLIMVELLLLE
jgi:hypothetical protein